jgi:hypothetical protein
MKQFFKGDIFALALALVGLAATISFAQSPSAKPDPKEQTSTLQSGVYYWTGITWQPMEPVTWSANGLKKEGKSSVFSFRHPKARVQLTEANPLFCYKFIDAAPGSSDLPPSQNVFIAHLDQKKDHRQLQTVSSAGSFKFSAGLGEKRALEIVLTDVAPGVILLSPKEPLSPGEYVLGASSLAISGYDFGFHAAK